MVIAHVVASFQVGGQEAMVLELATRQRAKGHRVIAITLEQSAPGPLQEAFTLAGIETLRISRLGPRFDVTLPIRMALALRRRGVEVVHVHNHAPFVYGTVAGCLLRCTVIATRHGSNERYGSPLWLRRQLSRWVDGYVAVSMEIAENARAHGLATEPKLTVIDNGIDLGKYTPRPEWRREVRAEFGVSDTARVIGIVSRLVEVKNVGLLLRSCLPHLGPETQLFIVGDGPERNGLESAAQHPHGRFARFLGERKDVARLLNGIDLFALSSKIEGHPLAVIEAMATALPVLAPKVGGIPDMVEDGKTGFLAGVEESAYADRLTDALNACAQWPAMGQAGRVSAGGRFSSETMAERYLALYEQARRHRHAS
jgi:glycosyltransferase involved in cell wall biosynthesis